MNLLKNSEGLYTTRTYKQTALLFLSTLLGSVFGIMGAINGVMRFFEGNALIVNGLLIKMNAAQRLKKNRKNFKNVLRDDTDDTNISMKNKV